MELDLSRALFINLLFRISLILYLSQEQRYDPPEKMKPLKHWMDPISKRVFLIFINGLQRDFLLQNSTPYLEEMVDNYGSFGVAKTGYFDTNFVGFKTILTGRIGHPFPFTYLESYCQENLLNYVAFKCGIGSIPPEINLECRYPDNRPFENFLKIPGLFTTKNKKSSLYIMSVDIDPVWINDYKKRLTELDDDIKFFTSLIESTFGDNKSTYIVTSARGSPVGEDLSMDSPVVAWGRGIAHSTNVTYMAKSDLTAMLCALLGVNFPMTLFGVVPLNMMQLFDYYEAEWTFYTIRHFESVLQAVDVVEHLIDSSELEMVQLSKRLNDIIMEILDSKIHIFYMKAGMVILVLTLWGINLVSFCSFTFARFFSHFKSLFLFSILLTLTFIYYPRELELMIASEFALILIIQNYKTIFKSYYENGIVITKTAILLFFIVTAAEMSGKLTSILLALSPALLWPIINKAYLRLNRFVLVTHFLSGAALAILPFSRVFGEMPNKSFVTFVGALFLINFYFLLSIFKKEIDHHIKINFLMVLVTIVCFRLPGKNQLFWVKKALSVFLLIFFAVSVFGTSGTLLYRLLKIYLTFFIPVLLLNIKIECVFYLMIVFHMFTWIFMEYHNTDLAGLQFSPWIFSIKPAKSLQQTQFSSQEYRQTVFFILYCFVSYFAIGHYPDLHAYDMYILPTFMYEYPGVVSHFLASFKFFLPFFIATISLITLRGLQEKDSQTIIAVSIWVSDIIGCVFLFHSLILNLFFRKVMVPARFSYFFIQQFATISVILSYFLGSYVLFCSKTFLQRVFRRSKECNDFV